MLNVVVFLLILIIIKQLYLESYLNPSIIALENNHTALVNKIIEQFASKYRLVLFYIPLINLLSNRSIHFVPRKEFVRVNIFRR